VNSSEPGKNYRISEMNNAVLRWREPRSKMAGLKMQEMKMTDEEMSTAGGK